MMVLFFLISAAFSTKTVRVGDHSILFQIWDTAGQEKVCETCMCVIVGECELSECTAC